MLIIIKKEKTDIFPLFVFKDSLKLESMSFMISFSFFLLFMLNLTVLRLKSKKIYTDLQFTCLTDTLNYQILPMIDFFTLLLKQNERVSSSIFVMLVDHHRY